MNSARRPRLGVRSIGLGVVLGVALLWSASASVGAVSTHAAKAGSARSATGKINIALFTEAAGSYYNPEIAAFKATARAQGANPTVYLANYDPSKQLSQCQSAIALNRFQVFVLHATAGALLTPCATQALAKGIKVVVLNNTLGPSFLSTAIQVKGISGQVIVPYAKDAQGTIDMAKQACQGHSPCQAAILIGEPTATYSSEKAKIEKAGLEKLGIQVVGEANTGYFSPAVALASTKAILAAHPGLNVVITDDDSNLAGIITAQQAGQVPKSIKLIGDGGATATLKAIKQGLVFGTIYYIPKTMTVAATKMALKAAHGQPIGKNNILMNQLGPKLLAVTKANVARAVPEW